MANYKPSKIANTYSLLQCGLLVSWKWLGFNGDIVVDYKNGNQTFPLYLCALLYFVNIIFCLLMLYGCSSSNHVSRLG